MISAQLFCWSLSFDISRLIMVEHSKAYKTKAMNPLLVELFHRLLQNCGGLVGFWILYLSTTRLLTCHRWLVERLWWVLLLSYMSFHFCLSSYIFQTPSPEITIVVYWACKNTQSINQNRGWLVFGFFDFQRQDFWLVYKQCTNILECKTQSVFLLSKGQFAFIVSFLVRLVPKPNFFFDSAFSGSTANLRHHWFKKK